MGKCDCGAKFTSFPNYHNDWCNALLGVSADVLHNFRRIQFKRIDAKKIDVILKETGQKLGVLEYEYWRGEFTSGVYREGFNSGDTRQAVMSCVNYLVASIRDDRMEEWKKYNLEEKRKYAERKPEVNPHYNDNSDWGMD